MHEPGPHSFLHPRTVFWFFRLSGFSGFYRFRARRDALGRGAATRRRRSASRRAADRRRRCGRSRGEERSGPRVVGPRILGPGIPRPVKGKETWDRGAGGQARRALVIDMSSRNGRGAEARSRGAGTARDRAVLVAVRALARAVDILSVAEPSSGSPRPRGRGVNNPPARGGDANPDVPPGASAPADHMSAGRRRRERRARAQARARSSPGTEGAPAQGGTRAQARPGTDPNRAPLGPAQPPGREARLTPR